MVKISIVFADPNELKQEDRERLVDDEYVKFEIIDGGTLKGAPKMMKAKGQTAAKQTPFAIVHDKNGKIKRVYYREEYKNPIGKMLSNLSYDKYFKKGIYEGAEIRYDDMIFTKRLMNIPVKIKKLDENAVIPKYETAGAACMDFVPVSVEYKEDIDCWVYHSGWSVELPVGFCMLVVPRSSSRKSDAYMPNTPGVVDQDFRGEVVACYKNRDPKDKKPPFELNGKGVAQITIIPIPRVEWVETDTLSSTERGAGGFGSTDAK